MPPAATWMDLNITTWSKLSQKEKQSMTSLYAESKKKLYKWIYLQNRLTDLQKELMTARGKDEGKG